MLLGGGSSPSARMIKYHAVRTGYCFQGYNFATSPEVKNFQVVPCSGDHEAEITLAYDYWATAKEYPGDKALNAQSYAECVKALSSYVGVASGKSRLTSEYFRPDANTWKSGDRRLICVVHLESGLLNGSVRGTGQ